MSTEKKVILYVEDEAIVALAGEKTLEQFGYKVIKADSGKQAVDIACGNNIINLILMDINLGKGIDGIEAAGRILEKMNIPIVFLTSHTEKKYVDKLKKITPYGFVVKNTGDNILQLTVEMAFELFEAHNKIKKNDEFNRLIVETANEGILSIDENTAISFVNKKMADMLGYSVNEITGKPFTNFMMKEDLPDHNKMITERKQGKTGSYERRFIRKDKSVLWMKVSSAPILDSHGSFRGSFGMFTDISAQKKAETNLKESELRYKLVSELASDYFFEFNISKDKKISLEYISDTFYTLTGFTREDIITTETLITMFHEEDRSRAVEALYSLIDANQTREVECRAFRKDKDFRWINIIAKSIWDEQENRAIAVFGVVKDINANKIAENALKKSEERFKSLIDLAPDAIFIGDMNGIIIEPNLYSSTLTGYDRSEMIGKNMTFLFSKEERKRAPFRFDLLNQGLTVHTERFLTCKGGNEIPVEMTTKMMPDNTFQSFIRDITERKHAEMDLRESEARARLYIENAPYGVFILNENGEFLKVNLAASKITGYSSDELLTMKIPDLLLSGFHEPEKKYIHQLYEEGQASGEIACRNKQGLTKYWSVDTVKLSSSRFIGFVMDITERKKAEVALRDSEDRYRMISSLTTDYFFQINIGENGRITLDMLSENFPKVTGRSQNDVVTPDLWEKIIHPDDIGKVKDLLYSVISNGNDAVIECRSFLQSGDQRWVQVVAHAVKSSENGRTTSIIGGVKDITERKNSENEIIEKNKDLASMNEELESTNEELAATNEELSSINEEFESSNEELIQTNMELEKATNELKKSKETAEKYLNIAAEIILSLDVNGDITLLNESGHKLLGYEKDELIGKNWFKTCLQKEIQEEVYGVFKKIINEEIGNVLAYENNVITKTGNLKIVFWHNTLLKDEKGRIIGTLSSGEDITEKQNLLETAQKHHKIESLGVMAGGIAHDFNNLLGGIYGYIDLARSSARDPETKEYLESTLNTMNRARGLTQQLLTFSKGGAPVRKIERLIPFIQETVQFALSGSNVLCNFDIPENLWLCNFDRNQIGQVIDNLVINALQAMPMGGTIEVKAQNISFKNKKHPILTDNYYVKITVKDFGIGIPPEILNRIFDPFFTTKVKGHGLGLATSYSIISRHEGIIDVESESGKWSAFHIYLPAVKDESSAKIKKKSSIQKGSGTIIVMDDEESIRDVVQSMLKALGYSVILTKDGNEVIDLIKEEYKANRKITGIILDLTVPGGMGGKAAITEIRKIDKDVPVFVSSGYAEDPIMSSPGEYGFTDSLCKPFMISDLSDLLDKYLNKNL